MNRIKICALVLSTCLALGSFAGCNKEEDNVTSVNIIVTTATEASVSGEPSAITVVPATSAESDETVSTENEYIELDADGQEYANTIVSNFAEQYIVDFYWDSASIEQLFDFAYNYLKINSVDSISYETKGDITYETFTFEKANEVIGKYIGISMTELSLEVLQAPPDSHGDQPAGPYYEDSKIWYEAADGGNCTTFAVVDLVVNNFDGTLALRFTVYQIDMETYSQLDENGIKAYYELTPDEAKADSTISAVATGTAVVNVGQSGDYYMLSYHLDK